MATLTSQLTAWDELCFVAKRGRVRKRKKRGANRKARTASSTKINIEDLKQFPPLETSDCHPQGYVNAVSSEGSLPVGVTTHYPVANGLCRELNEMASPFIGGMQGVLDRRTAPLQEIGSTPCSTSSRDIHETGDVSCSVGNNAPTNQSHPSSQLVADHLRHIVLKQPERCRTTSSISQSQEEMLEDFILSEQLDQQPGYIDNNMNTVYLARHRRSGGLLAVRKVHDRVLRNTQAVDIAERWKNVHHPNLVQLHSITTQHRSSEASLLFAYEYHPNARTLHEFFLFVSNDETINEKLIWSFTTQLVSAIRAVHMADLAVRTLTPTSVLVSPIDNCSVRINCLAIADVLEIAHVQQFDYLRQSNCQYRAHPDNQHKDIVQLGWIVVFMIECMGQRGGTPSEQLSCLTHALISGRIGKVDDMMLAIASNRVFDELSEVQARKNDLEREICEELQSRRLLRLSILVSQVIQECRSSLRGTKYGAHKIWDSQKDEDMLLILLFGDFLFGNKCLYHVFSTLNKLDAGTDEKIHLHGSPQLHSDNDIEARSCAYIVTYADIKSIMFSYYAQISATSSCQHLYG